MTAPEAFTRDAALGGRLHLVQPARGHRFGHDALLLAAAAPDDTRALADFGAGVGAAGLAALMRLPAARGVLVEIDPGLADLAGRNAADNAMADRCAVVCGDVARLGRPGGPEGLAPASLDLVLANPPFNAPGAHRASPDPDRARAHMAQSGTLADWATAAYRCLAPGGMLAMILRPTELAPLLAALEGRYGAAVLLPIHARPGAPAVRLVVRARKGRRTAPAIAPSFLLADADGTPGAAADAVLRGRAPLPFPDAAGAARP
ncbi:tRNA1(Val) (adenine(37)-N6)-methyltransferase [Aquabacter spiritensis]|uniref:tRNA1(Val) A37 N6-methylase TrmN6 n=1 Tax=Aquabacter spiritensis TaxID=933073 RepID=A0A4V2UYS1_9HYPH|nr:methyltransferase [Aquabacter spiritensis]TCT08218.1 tRNA1(Val) A37 N6-methylase TrmN6 [Aquabacter spiritensis]